MLLPPDHRNLKITDKISLARDLFGIAGTTLMNDKHIRGLLAEVIEKARTSRQVMQELRINELCRQCDEEEGGSCCGAGIENRYDAVLLLLNLLAGVNLPASRFDEKSCYFLGPEGCVLKIRHTLCVNFLCDKIEENLSLEELVRLQEVIGEEIDLTFVLYEAVRKFLRSLTGNGND
ncbi:MAG TPA: hypothetical protein ENI41_02610 [Deltaproteobacteria bacterium]|nr:hypothetical protein [Deltaproteobacteria bacterium]